MNISENTLIDKYLRGELSQEEQIAFDKKMLDVEFINQINKYKILYESLKEQDKSNLKSFLQEVESEIIEQTPKKIRYIKIISGIAAIFLIFITSFFIYNNINQELETKDLYALYYKPYPNITDPITKGQNSYSVFQKYENGDYQSVIKYFQNKNELNEEERFYLASSFLGFNKYEEAKKQFEQIIDDNKFGQASQWYLALICLVDQSQDCSHLFEKISNNPNHIYSQLASSILSKLPSNK